MTTHRTSQAGFTLTELAVSAVVVGAVFALVLGIVLNQKRVLEGTETMRETNESGKDAVVEIERRLRTAGFGVDPRFAFDFLWFRCTSGEQLTGPSGRPTCRDRRVAPDRLVFNARSLRYRIDQNGQNGCTDAAGCLHGDAWRLTARTVTGNPPTMTITARAGDRFMRGQVVLAVCPNGFRSSMGTVAQAVAATSDGPLTLTLYQTNAAIPYFANDFGHACYGTTPTVFRVDRFAYWIEVMNGTPWLVLDQGLDLDGDNSDPWDTRDPGDLVPIASDVDDLQVAYVMERRPGATPLDLDGNFVLGDASGTSAPPEEPDPAAPAPGYQTPIDDATRRNLHPANIRAVRVSLVLRSPRADPAAPANWTGDPMPRLENSLRILSNPGRFRRVPISTSVAIRNMNSRGMFVY